MRGVFSIALFVLGGSALLGAILDIPRLTAVRDQAPDIIVEHLLFGEVITVAMGVACLVLGAKLRNGHSLSPTIEPADRRDIVVLTPEAACLFRAIVKERGFPPDTALRIAFSADRSPPVDVQYDTVSTDGCDWVGESSGVAILVGKGVADGLKGLMVDAQGGQYTFRGVNDGAGAVN